MIIPNRPGLREHLSALGWTWRERNGEWTARSPDGVEDDSELQLIIDSYDPIEYLKVVKRAAIRGEGLTRIQVIYPSILDFDHLRLVRDIVQSIVPASRQLTADLTRASNIYQAGQSAIAAVNAAQTVEELDSVDPTWP